MQINTFKCADLCLKYQYIVDAHELLTSVAWHNKVLQTVYMKDALGKAKQNVVYAHFTQFISQLKKEVRKAPSSYDAETLTKILLTKRLELTLEYPEIFPDPTESLGWYADKQLIKAYLKGEIYSKEYDIQAVLDEKVRVRQVLEEERKLENQRREEIRLKEQEIQKEKQLKYENEKVSIEKGMVFRLLKDIRACYTGTYMRYNPVIKQINLEDYVKYTKIKPSVYVIDEVLVEGKVHPSKLKK